MKKTGRVRTCVFHPKSKRCVGLLVKRPDVALMFHRADMFVRVGGWDMIDGNLVVRDLPDAIDKSACKHLGINLDECIVWHGLAVMLEDGQSFGIVDNVLFDPEVGTVSAIDVSQGATANTLLGRRRIPAEDILGFRRGMGTQLYVADDDDEQALGALIVKDSASETEVVGGAAEKAGEAAAVAEHEVKKVVRRVKPKAKEAAEAAEDAAEKAVYATGRQIGRTKGMFSNFKEEFKKGMNGD